MTDHKTICDEILAAGEKATEGGWFVDNDDHPLRLLTQRGKCVAHFDDETPVGVPFYITLAANNATRLALFTVHLVAGLKTALKALGDKDGSEADAVTAKFWEESK